MPKAGTTCINWVGMSEQERYDKAKKRVEAVLADNSFNATKNAAINDIMNRYKIKEQILEELGVVKSDMKRNKVANMSKDERLEWAIAYIKENMRDGVFAAKKHQNFYDSARYRGVYKEAFKTAGAVKPKETWKLSFKALMKAMEPYKKKDIAKIKTLNEAVANMDFFDSSLWEQKLGNDNKNPYSERLKSVFPLSNDIYLSQLSPAKLEAILLEGWDGVKSTQTKLLGFIQNNILAGIFIKGVCIPAVVRFDGGKYISEYVKAVAASIKEPKTLSDYCYLNWNKSVRNKQAVLEFLQQHGDVLVKDFKWQTVMDYLPYGFAEETLHVWRYLFKKDLLLPLQKKGILSESFFSLTPFDYIYEKHLEKKAIVKKEEQTVMWYALEHHNHLSMQSRSIKKSLFMIRFGPFESVKAVDFTAEDFQALKNRKSSVAYIPVVQNMIEDGLCPYSVMETEVDEREFRYDDDVWIANGQQLDFTLIDEVFRDASKTYAKSKTKKCTQKMIGWKNLLELWKMLAHIGVNSLEELDNSKKSLLYLSLRKMANEGLKQNNKALRVLGAFQSLVKCLKELNYNGLSKQLVIVHSEFTLPKIPKEIDVYTEDEAQAIVDFLMFDPADEEYQRICKECNLKRLEVCAIGLLALSARRIGEIIQSVSADSTGLRVDDLIKVGASGELALRYYSPKQKATQMVYLGDLVGQRQDPFAQVLEELIPKLFKEALDITKPYRKHLPDSLSNLLFVEKKNGNKRLFGVIQTPTVWKKMKLFFQKIGVNPSRNPHEFRHYLATHLILAGGTIMDAADALGDTTKTVAKNYHKYADRIDTLKLMAAKGRTQLVDAKEDSEYLKSLDENNSKVCSPQEMSETGHRMLGGSCTESIDGMQACPSYQMMYGARSCSGCKHLEVNCVDNKQYWKKELQTALEGVDESKTGSMQWSLYETRRKKARVMLDDIKTKELEYECGLS